jgi:hypothetical protein
MTVLMEAGSRVGSTEGVSAGAQARVNAKAMKTAHIL